MSYFVCQIEQSVSYWFQGASTQTSHHLRAPPFHVAFAVSKMGNQRCRDRRFPTTCAQKKAFCIKKQKTMTGGRLPSPHFRYFCDSWRFWHAGSSHRMPSPPFLPFCRFCHSLPLIACWRPERSATGTVSRSHHAHYTRAVFRRNAT
jgi:hypothetical protein